MAIVLVMVAAVGVPLAVAQGAVGAPHQEVVLPENLAAEDIDALVARLTDLDARRLLLQQLHKATPGETASTGSTAGGLGVALVHARMRLGAFAETLRARFGLLAAGARLAPATTAQALDRITGGPDGPGFRVLIPALGGLLALGVAVHCGVIRVTRSWRRLGGVVADSFATRALGSLFRAGSDLAALVAFAVVTMGLASAAFGSDEVGRTFVVTYLTGAAVIYGAALVSRLVLSPEAPALRPLPLDDELAAFLHRWLVRIAAVGSLAWLTAGLVILTGMPIEVHLVIVIVTGALVAACVIAMILAGREPVATLIRVGASSPVAETGPGDGRWNLRLAATWHLFAIGYLLVVWLLWAVNMLAQGPTTVWAAIFSIAVVAVLPLVDRALGRGLAQVFGATDGGGRARYGAVVQRGLRTVLVVLALVMLLEMWGFDILAVIGPGGGANLRAAVFDIAVTLLLAYVVWQVVRTAIDRHLAERNDDGTTVVPSARARTLLPLLRKCVLAVLVVMVTMIVLSSIGVDIGPLLAGAGVVGLAVGFGAQTLVKDIVSGIFFLIDDAFRIGEYIEMGNLRGEVEAISLRSLRVRHHRGAVHTIPFSELRSVTNYNRDWVIQKIEFRVPYDTDLGKVKKIIKAIGQELSNDPEIGPKLLEPLKSQGVNRMEDSAIVIRAKFMCRPREQFVISRVAYQRLQEEFAKNGIRFAHRNVTVHVPPGTPPHVTAEAAAGAIGGDGPKAV